MLPASLLAGLNPIEMMWSKVKSLLRKAQARTTSDLLKATSAALAAVTPQYALGWFTACGYKFIFNALYQDDARLARAPTASQPVVAANGLDRFWGPFIASDQVVLPGSKIPVIEML